MPSVVLNRKHASTFVILLCVFCMACDPGFPTAKPTCMIAPHSNDYGDANEMGMTYYSSIEDAKKCAASTGRRLFVMFTGYACVSDIGTHWNIVRDDRNRKLIAEQYVFVVLFVDDKDSLSQPEIVNYSDTMRDTAYTVGQMNSALEVYHCRQNSQPVYSIFSASMNLVELMGYSKDAEELEAMLRRGIEAQ